MVRGGRPTSSTTYGCPFLYAECRIYYGSVLAAKGRWADAERELDAGLRITDGTCPGLHARALTRLAALRVRQGRLEEAEHLLAGLGAGIDGGGRGGPVAGRAAARSGDAPAAQPSPRAAPAPPGSVTAPTCADGARPARRRAPRRRATSAGAADAAGRLEDVAAAAQQRAARRRWLRRGRGRVWLLAGDDDEAAVVAPRGRAGAWVGAGLPVRGGPHARTDLARRARRAGQPDVAVEHARRRTGRLRRSSAPPGSRSGRRAPPLARRARPAPGPRASGRSPNASRRCSRLLGARAVQPRDRRAAPRQPQDRVAPREQHPDQARPAQPGRGRGVRSRAARDPAPRRDRPTGSMGQLPDARRRGRRRMIGS